MESSWLCKTTPDNIAGLFWLGMVVVMRFHSLDQSRNEAKTNASASLAICAGHLQRHDGIPKAPA